jgi:peroxiredoxin
MRWINSSRFKVQGSKLINISYKRTKTPKALSLFGVLVSLCLLNLFLAACGDNDGAGGPKVGQAAPDFQLATVSGSPVKLSDFKGKPVLVNFWATWCMPCKYEMPQIEEIYRQYQAQGLVVLGINDKEDAPTVKQFVSDGGYSWPMLLDTDESLKTRYQVVGMPTSFFVDRQGVVRSTWVGGMEKDTLQTQLSKIL